MFGKALLIKKYPYLCYSPNLMEYFTIIGYQENFVPQLIESSKKRQYPYSPTILSSINSNTDYGIVDNHLIIGQIFPDNPKIIPVNKYDNLQAPLPSKIIYSFCFDSTDGKNKIFYICFGYKFYEQYQYFLGNNTEEYYIPKAFCIISQYACFSFFEYLCKNVYILMTTNNSDMIPIEITLYNIINYIPSPINYKLHLDIFSYIMSGGEIEINQLSGYPYIDFDLSEIFNIIPLNLVIEIYLLTLLEQSMLFFSSNLENLNIIMYIMYVLNYPCNDSSYFWHIVSVSKNNLVEENKFVGKIMVSLLGVNATYDENIDTSAFGRYHFIVDIDNKKLFLKEAEDLSTDEIEDVDNLFDLQNYIENIIKEKNTESYFLKKFILQLKKNLENITNKPELLVKPFEFPQTAKKINFFKKNLPISNINRKIQEIFYDFNINILMIFYQDNSLDSSFDKIKKDEMEQVKKLTALRISEIPNLTKNEMYFCYLFRATVKYKIYFENFVQNQESIDVFKIPLIFSEEFINIKMKDTNNKISNKISYFNLIDALYFNNKPQIISISLNNILFDFMDKLKTFFSSSLYSNNKGKQLITLNKKVINKYIFVLNNYYQKEELMDLFPSMRIQDAYTISYIDRRNILSILQITFENENFVDTNNYLIFSIVYVFATVISFHSYKKMMIYMNKLINIMSKIKFFLRQNIYIIMETLFKYFQLQNKTGNYPEMGVSSLKMYYYMLGTFMKQNMVVPNEEMMYILSNFFSGAISKEINNSNKIADTEIDSEANFEINDKKNCLIFMKHCFTAKKIIKSETMIKAAMKENGKYNIIILGNKKKLLPAIVIKIKEYTYSADLLSPKKIYKFSQNIFNSFFESEDLDVNKIKIRTLRAVILNLIMYGKEIKEIGSLVDFLIYSLYLIRNLGTNINKESIEKEETEN